MFAPQLAFLFESADFTEWIVLLAVILIVVGPQRLPEMARKLGRWTETFRRAADEFKRQIMTMDQEVHKQEADYMDYAKDMYETPSYDEPGQDPVTETAENKPETSTSSEAGTPEYQDAYPSEGIPTPEQTEMAEAPGQDLEKEAEKTV
jgi:sec-independent protein translocase protein TatB